MFGCVFVIAGGGIALSLRAVIFWNLVSDMSLTDADPLLCVILKQLHCTETELKVHKSSSCESLTSPP